MRKLIYSALTALTLFLVACSGGDDSPAPVQNIDTSQLLGKWKIYKAVYGEGTEPLLYDTSGCGKEILEFTNDGDVTETIYIDEDCNFGGRGSYSWWVQDGGILFGAHNSYYHIVTINGDELVLDATQEADYIKYYKRTE